MNFSIITVLLALPALPLTRPHPLRLSRLISSLPCRRRRGCLLLRLHSLSSGRHRQVGRRSHHGRSGAGGPPINPLFAGVSPLPPYLPLPSLDRSLVRRGARVYQPSDLIDVRAATVRAWYIVVLACEVACHIE